MSTSGEVLRVVAEAAERNVVRLMGAKAQTEQMTGKALEEVPIAGALIENQRLLWTNFAQVLRELAQIEDER